MAWFNAYCAVEIGDCSDCSRQRRGAGQSQSPG
jgi:hypothetical protein